MSSGKAAFRLTDAARLVKAAIAGGLPPERIRLIFDLKNNKILVECRDDTQIEITPNPWDDDAP
jgi:hypothetical protein